MAAMRATTRTRMRTKGEVRGIRRRKKGKEEEEDGEEKEDDSSDVYSTTTNDEAVRCTFYARVL